MSNLVGKTLGRFDIVDKIGAGGMGEVYRARDTELGRDVAIKVLPEAVASDRSRLGRFQREARALAALSHPNLLEVYDIGSSTDVHFVVTELLEGDTLRERIPVSGIPWQKAAEIGAAVAEGLAAAHDRGIVHRDLKPENLFITSDGRIKILDFGLAQVQEQVDPEGETGTQTPAGTEAGTVVGTPGYMAPEQIKALTADARSDIFALGCVLYEMIAGSRAFDGDTGVEVMAAILKEEPPHLSSTTPAVPVELERAIRRCLEKRPEARFQSAADLAYSLRNIGTGQAVPVTETPTSVTPAVERARPWSRLATAGAFILLAAITSWWALTRRDLDEPDEQALDLDSTRVAIAHLENRTGDASLDSLGVLAADSIVRRFAETGAAEVVPLDRLPAAGPDGEQTPESDLLDQSRERGAGLLLAGAYYLEGARLRFQARLIDTSVGDLVYAFDPLTVARQAAADGMESLAERVVAAVTAHNNPWIDIALVRPPETYAAFQAFQRGEELWDTDFPRAIDHYRRAYQMEPSFHWARIQAVWAHLNSHDIKGCKEQLEILDGQIDQLTPFEQNYVRYQRSVMEWDRATSVKLLRRQMELAPHDLSIQEDLAWRSLDLNRPGEAADILDSLGRHRPPDHSTDWWTTTKMTAAQHMLGSYQRELEYAKLGLERFPGLAYFFLARARALAAMDQIPEVALVIDEFLRVQTRGGSAGWLMLATARELRAHGHRQAADELADRSVRWYQEHPEALAEASRAFAMELWTLGYPVERRAFASALWMVGRHRDAEQLISEMIDRDSDDYQLTGWLGTIAASSGDRDRALEIARNLPEGDSARAVAWKAYWQASIAAYLGDRDRAVDLLAEAFSKGFPYGVYLHSTLEFEPLWDYPPFQVLITPKG